MIQTVSGTMSTILAINSINLLNENSNNNNNGNSIDNNNENDNSRGFLQYPGVGGIAATALRLVKRIKVMNLIDEVFHCTVHQFRN